jgi:HEAT repeats
MDRSELLKARLEKDVARLTWALKDPDVEIRGTAASYLGKLRSAEAGPALVACLDDPSEGMRMTVLRALARIGDRRAIPAVANTAATDPALAVSTRAIDVLAQLGDPRGIAGFVSLLTQTDRYLANRPEAADRKTKWRLQKWSARRVVELRLRDAAPVVRAAVPGATSFRERLLLRRTAWRLRHPSRRSGRLKGYLWWWAVLLGVFVLSASISGNGSSAWAATQYFALAVFGLSLLLLFLTRRR